MPYSSGVYLQRIVTTVGLSTAVYLNGAFPSTIPEMSLAFNNQNFTLNGLSFNISLGNVTNPQDVTDVTTVPILIKNTDLIAFSSSLGYSPQLTPQNLSAFNNLTVASELNVSQVTNITLKFSNYEVSTIEITFPLFFSTLTQCCIDSACSQGNISSCVLTSGSTQNTIKLLLNSPRNISTLLFTVNVVPYMATFTNQPVMIVSGLPSA